MKINHIEIKTLEPIPTIALSHTGDYSGIGATFEKLGTWAWNNDYWAKNPRMIGVYHDDPTVVPVEKRRSKACLEEKPGMEPDEGMTRYTVTGGKYLVMNAEVKMAEYKDAWMKVYAEVAARKLDWDTRDVYELYVSCVDATQDDDAPWIVEFCVPVK